MPKAIFAATGGVAVLLFAALANRNGLPPPFAGRRGGRIFRIGSTLTGVIFIALAAGELLD